MKMFKRITSLALILMVLLTTVTGCGKDNSSNENTMEDAKLPEFTYVAEYEKIDTDEYLGDIFLTQKGFYYVESNYGMDLYMYEDAIYETTEEEAEYVEREFEESINTYNLCYFDFSTSETTKTAIELDPTERVSKTILAPDGSLVLITEQSEYMDDNYEEHFYINTYDLETMEVKKTEITDQIAAEYEYLYIEYAEVDKEGNIYLASGDQGMWVFDQNHEMIAKLDFASYINSMALTKDDELVIAMYSDNGDFVLQKFDKDAKAFGQPQKVGFFIYYGKAMIPGLEQDLIVKTEEGLSEYSFETNETSEIVNWINSDINGDIVQSFTLLEDGRILLFTQNYMSEDMGYELVYLTKVKTSELPEKTIISLKTVYLDYNLKAKVIEFNKNSSEYRVVVETYDTTDYEAAFTKYQTDLATGNASDIVDLSYSDIGELASKGILEDLYTYIDADEEYERSDFFENVLEAYTIEEKLTAVTPSVYLQTMIAKTKFVGEEPGWTPADIVALTNSLADDTKLLEYGSKNDVLSMLVSYDLNSYIDWSTGECNFNSDSFMDILEFANSFPTQEEYEAMFEDGMYDYDMMNSEDKIASDKLILIQGYFSEISDYQYTLARFNEPAICIGFPCVEGTGTFLGASGTALGINSASPNKDGAWEFIRYFLSEEAAEDSWGLPVNKKAYDKKIQEAMKVEYFSDEEIEEGWVWVPEDKQIVSEDGRVVRPVSSVWYGNEEVYVYAPSQEMVDEFTELYENTTSLTSYNMEILAIIKEEADAYFTGQKTASDVANIIQSRLQIYINENR